MTTTTPHNYVPSSSPAPSRGSKIARGISAVVMSGLIVTGTILSHDADDASNSIAAGDCLSLSSQEQAADGSSTFEIKKVDCGAPGARFVRDVVAPGVECPAGSTPYTYTTRDPSGNPEDTGYCLDGS